MRSLAIASLMVILAAAPAAARTWLLEPDGSGDAPTINAAVDSATAGDVIELACGTYHERGIELKSGVTLRSRTGDPDCVTIDGQYQDFYGAIFQFWGVDNTALIEGLTITGGKSVDPYTGIHGGGMVIGGSDPWVVRCRITGNIAKSGGGVMLSWGARPTFVECEITGNEAMFTAGGILVYEGVFTAYETTIEANVSGLAPRDGIVDTGGEAEFHCCGFDPMHWEFDGVLVVDDANCSPVTSEARTWDFVKALYR